MSYSLQQGLIDAHTADVQVLEVPHTMNPHGSYMIDQENHSIG